MARTDTAPEIEYIDVDALHGMRRRRDDFALIDIMPPGEFARAHIPRSINIPFGTDFADRVDDAVGGDRSRRVVVYGDDLEAAQTGPAVGALRAAGFDDVVVLAGGTRAWKDAGSPIESDVRGGRTRVRRPRRLITHPMLWLLGACFGAYVLAIGFIGPAYSSHWAVWLAGGMLLFWAAFVVTSFIGGVAEEPTGEEGPGPDQPS